MDAWVIVKLNGMLSCGGEGREREEGCCRQLRELREVRCRRLLFRCCCCVLVVLTLPTGIARAFCAICRGRLGASLNPSAESFLCLVWRGVHGIDIARAFHSSSSSSSSRRCLRACRLQSLPGFVCFCCACAILGVQRFAIAWPVGTYLAARTHS